MDTTQMQTLAEHGGFRYEVATEERREAIVALLCESFSREPWRFEVLDLDGRRIDKILVSKLA